MISEEKSPSIVGKLLHRYAPIIAFSAICAFVGQALSALGFRSWILDLAAHFQAQYFLVALVCLPISAVWLVRENRGGSAENGGETRSQRPIIPLIALAFSITATLIGAWNLAPFYIGTGPPPTPGSASIKIMEINVNTSNTSYQSVENLVIDRNPDILLLLEVDQAWLDHLPRIAQAYPHHVSWPRPDNFGIALFAKNKSSSGNLFSLPQHDLGLPCVRWKFKFAGKDVVLFGLHALPPVRRSGFRIRNAMLAEIAYLARNAATEGAETIILGDFNATPWSCFFKRLTSVSGTRDARRGFGISPSWPSIPTLFPFLIPIDHCLVSPGFSVTNFAVGGDVGSDHYPLEVELRPALRKSIAPAGTKPQSE